MKILKILIILPDECACWTLPSRLLLFRALSFDHSSKGGGRVGKRHLQNIFEVSIYLKSLEGQRHAELAIDICKIFLSLIFILMSKNLRFKFNSIITRRTAAEGHLQNIFEVNIHFKYLRILDLNQSFLEGRRQSWLKTFAKYISRVGQERHWNRTNYVLQMA